MSESMPTDLTEAPAPSFYDRRQTLTLRVEFVRQLRRRRTIIAFAVGVVLPLIVVAAVKLGPSSSGNGGGFGGGDLDLVGLATAGAWNFSLTMLFFGAGFLLTIIAAMFLGDSVASEASWSTLRYLLAAPIPRRRLLRAKALVGLLLTAITLLILVGASWIIGALAFGTTPLVSPLGASFDVTESWVRLAIVAGYIMIVLLIPGLPILAQAAMLAVLSAASVAIGRRWYRANPVATSDPLLNERSMRMLGEIVVVEEPIVGGQGRVRVGDGAWLARGPDAPAGARMQVVGVADTVLLVEPANAAA